MSVKQNVFCSTGQIKKALGQDSPCVCWSVCSLLASQPRHLLIPLLSLLPGRQNSLFIKNLIEQSMPVDLFLDTILCNSHISVSVSVFGLWAGLTVNLIYCI